jgi:hypothetical protein
MSTARHYNQAITLRKKDLYRHPQRQSHDLKEYYVMQYEIYSLGICLLEIGLWRSFILYSQDQKTPTPSQNFVSNV